jgi:hypothetical protein
MQTFQCKGKESKEKEEEKELTVYEIKSYTLFLIRTSRFLFGSNCS